MKRVLGIGNALVDVMTMLDSDAVIGELGFPRGSMTLVDHDKSTKIRKLTSHLNKKMASGGSVANTIHGLGKLNIGTGYIGAIGMDEQGDFFEGEMQEAGVTNYLVRKEIGTGIAVALVSPDSERTFATYLGAAVQLSAIDLKQNFFVGYDILYLEGYLITNFELVDKACKMAKREGMKIAIDLSSFNVVEAFLDNFRYIVKEYVDIIFANDEESRAFTGKEYEKAILELSGMCDVSVIKLGEKGSVIASGSKIIRVKAERVTAVDTTGAGDLYAAGFLYGMASGATITESARYAGIIAGKVIEVIGARMNSEDWKGIEESINRIKSS